MLAFVRIFMIFIGRSNTFAIKWALKEPFANGVLNSYSFDKRSAELACAALLVVYVRLDTVVVYIFLSNGGCIEAFFIHDDGLLGDGLAALQLLDDVIDVGSLERIALSIVVPVACLQFFQSHLLQSKPITITSLPTPWEILALSRAATAPLAISSFSA